MSGIKNVFKLLMRLSLLASMGFAALFSLAQTDAALAATAPSLGTAATFAVMGGSAVNNTGNSVITGDLGVSPSNIVTGFPPGILTPPYTIHAADAVAAQAQSDLTIAYNNLAGQPCVTDLTGQDLGGMTLTPGVYCFSASAQLTGALTLDAQGSAAAVFVFQIGSTLTTAVNSSVSLINGGSSCNVFWQVGSSATIGVDTSFAGNILALTSITLNTGADVSGRVLARNGAVTLDSNIVGDVSTCTGAMNLSSRRAIKFEDTYCSVCADPVIEEHYVMVDGAAPALDLTTRGTIEAWIKPASFNADAGIVMKGTANAGYGFGLAGGALFSGGTTQNIGFVLGNDTPGPNYVLIADDPTTKPLQAGKWYHIACVWDDGGNAANPGVPGATMAIYINGVLEATSNIAIPNVRSNDEDLMLGLQRITNPDGQYFGTLEEFRVWSLARTETEIRENMCRTLGPAAPITNMPCCLRFDEQGGSGVGDSSGNGNIGVLTNVVRLCSEAPIGDTSDYDYAGYTVTLDTTPVSSESLTATATGGTWGVAEKSGLQVYRVEEAPEDGGSPQDIKLFGDRGYWGVFVTGGVAPTYTVLYQYDEAGIGDEANLRMMFRNYNCQPRRDLEATLNANVNTLTQAGLSGTEFILGSTVDPRNAIAFDGVDEYVDVTDHASLRLTTDGTLEAWVYATASLQNGGILNKGDTNNGYVLSLDNLGNISFSLYSGGSGTTVTTTAPIIVAATWFHVAATWDDADVMHLYINGVLDNSSAAAQASGGTIGSNLTIGYDSANYFKGWIDEVRVWNTARNQTAIRNTMCKKVTTADAGFANLMGYWRFDEETDSAICPDYSANNNDGTMNTTTPAPGFADIRASRICSSAPIGDDSAYDYNAATSNAILTSGDIFTATGNAGSWAVGSGIHVYRLDEAPVYPPDLWTTPNPPYIYTTPNGLTPPAGWSSVDYYRYFGVFLTDWTDAPTYDVIYNYNGNPSVPQNESVVALARRDEYCDRTWVDAVYALNTTTNTLTKTADGQNGPPKENPEYILAGKDDPLAIVLAGFTAIVDESGKCIEISWETATEIDTIGFQLWRREAKNGPYGFVPQSYTRAASMSETQGAAYSYTDCDVTLDGKTNYYYKLEEIDMDNTKDNAFYGPFGPVPDAINASQVSDSKGAKKDKACFISAITE